jgi:hypothetical protein
MEIEVFNNTYAFDEPTNMNSGNKENEKEGTSQKEAQDAKEVVVESPQQQESCSKPIHRKGGSSGNAALQPLNNGMERAKVMKAIGTITDGIAARVDSPDRVAFMYFVDTTNWQEEMLLFPTADNTYKVARNYDRMPKRLHRRIQKMTPIDQRQPSKFLCDWIESTWDGKKQGPSLPFGLADKESGDEKDKQKPE